MTGATQWRAVNTTLGASNEPVQLATTVEPDFLWIPTTPVSVESSDPPWMNASTTAISGRSVRRPPSAQAVSKAKTKHPKARKLERSRIDRSLATGSTVLGVHRLSTRERPMTPELEGRWVQIHQGRRVAGR
jgi:hypothetical protein